MKTAITATALLGFTPLLAGAAEAPALGSSGVVDAAYLTRLIGGLLAVIALFVVMAWILRNMGIGTVSKDGMKHLNVMATLPVGNRERILLLETGGDRILVGVTQERIETLHVIPAPKRRQSFSEALDENLQDNATEQTKSS